MAAVMLKHTLKPPSLLNTIQENVVRFPHRCEQVVTTNAGKAKLTASSGNDNSSTETASQRYAAMEPSEFNPITFFSSRHFFKKTLPAIQFQDPESTFPLLNPRLLPPRKIHRLLPRDELNLPPSVESAFDSREEAITKLSLGAVACGENDGRRRLGVDDGFADLEV